MEVMLLLDLLGLDQRLAPDIFPFYFLLSKRRHGLDIEELSNSDLEHFSLHYMLLGYYDIAQPGNVNGLPTIILGAYSHVLLAQQAGGSLAQPVLPAGERFSRIF